MKFAWALAALLAAAPALAADDPSQPPPDRPRAFRIKPKASSSDDETTSGDLVAPDTDLIDAPTSAVLDYGGYGSRSRFYSGGGILQYVNFGVYNGVNIGASMSVDGLIGNSSEVRVRAPNAQVKWRFYDGDRYIPSLAVGYDGQGYDYNEVDQKYNNRQRGFYLVASQELGLPGLMLHPSVNISDVNSNDIFGALPLSYNIKDKVLLMAEWDNINDFLNSRFNSGLRVYVTPKFDIDFAVRAIGQGGHYDNGDSRGPERIVQLRYTASF